MIEPVLVIFTIIMILLMAVAAMLAVILAAGKNSSVNRGMRNVSIILLGYMIFAFLQYYFQKNMMSEAYVKIPGCLADACYFMLVSGWLYIIDEFADNVRTIKIKSVFIVTALYGTAAELIVILAGTCEKDTPGIFVEDMLWRSILMVINALYGLFIFVLGSRYFVLSLRNPARDYHRSGAMLFSGLLSLYMLWIVVQDYDMVFNADKRLTSSIIVDPIFIVYCILDIAVICFFFKKDPLELFSRQDEQEREGKLQMFAETNELT
ncbi:MAG: hypothetical protein GX671_01745, partial [Clostridiales bacterium]|nr:hypothetical protein [Clostridiales bacterium]